MRGLLLALLTLTACANLPRYAREVSVVLAKADLEAYNSLNKWDEKFQAGVLAKAKETGDKTAAAVELERVRPKRDRVMLAITEGWGAIKLIGITIPLVELKLKPAKSLEDIIMAGFAALKDLYAVLKEMGVPVPGGI